jgi:Zn-dependent protease/CBS domain-containing protein
MIRRKGLSLGKVFGIPLRVDYSWFLIFIVLTWLLAGSYYPGENPGWPAYLYWLLGAATAAAFFASVLLHELGHSLAARRFGLPVRSITLYLFGGAASISEEPDRPGVDFLIASAGPAVSLVLAALFWILQPLAAAGTPLLSLLQYLAYINAALLAFNILPGFPLDGGRMFRAAVWGITKNYRRATMAAAALGRGLAYLLILFGIWLAFFGAFLNGIWIVFIGWYLLNAAEGEVVQQTVRSLLAGHKASQAMGRNYATIPGDIPLQRLADDHVLGEGRRFFLVEEGGAAAGIMTLHEFRAVPRPAWPSTLVSQAMVPMEKTSWIGPEEDLWDAIRKMNADGVNQLPVMAGGKIQGVLSRENILQYMQSVKELR